jgi:hypothetical protein
MAKFEFEDQLYSNGFTFTYSEKFSSYECRGGNYFNDYHDQVPEPKLQKAADKLAEHLKSQNIQTTIEWGEKGWIEVIII